MITEKRPTRRLKKALKEVEEIASGKKETKSYETFEQLLEDLDN